MKCDNCGATYTLQAGQVVKSSGGGNGTYADKGPIGQVTYKGQEYNLLFKGKTKFGNRAKLQFLNGKKEFWVPLEALEGEVPEEDPAF